MQVLEKPPMRRFTVELNQEDWEKLLKAVEKKEKETGYPVKISIVIRELVNENL